ncbi:hypothetical protein [Marinobacter nauticus]|uniref:hypothetical protein n=1 Tax=Marinobacter nauticus TaxID=2743 RepID=UPI003736D6A9
MSLTYPNSNCEFKPSLAFFLGEFDIYDREESLGGYLNGFDPNDRKQVRLLSEQLFFNGARVKSLTAEHKKVLFELLVEALGEPDHDFRSVFDMDEDDCFCQPFDWEINDYRLFFEKFYRLAINHWGDELRALNVTLPELQALNIL